MSDSFPKSKIAALCLKYGPQLSVQATQDDEGHPLEGSQILWALSGNESSFGANCTPRFEPAYFTGRYATDTRQSNLIALYGRAAACSYGPWQILLVNAGGFRPDELREDAEKACQATVNFLNQEILGRRKARTLEQIGDAFNSGSWKDANIPTDYIRKLTHNYYTECLSQ